MKIEADLGAWSYQTVLDLVEHQDLEAARIEYKEALFPAPAVPQNAADELRGSIRRAVCSMSNTDGGLVIFGVKDRAQSASTAAARIVGVPLKEDLAAIFGKLVQAIRPALRFDCSPRPIVLPNATDRGVFVVKVDLSPVRPHEVEGVFYRRSDGGESVRMTAYEVRDQMLYSEDRHQSLVLLALELRLLADKMKYINTNDNQHAPDYDLNTTFLKELLAKTMPLLPKDGVLLGDLFSLIHYANKAAAGMMLIRSNAGSEKGWRENIKRMGLQTNMGELERLSKECEQQLRKAFALPQFPA